MAVRDICGYRVHGTGSIERDNSYQIFNALRLETHEHAAHTRGFKLEHALRFAGREHFEHFFVLVIYHILGEIRDAFFYTALCIVYNSQSSQTEEIYLKKSEFLEGGHGKLRDYRLVVSREGHITLDRIAGYDYARRMGRSMARHPLNFAREVNKSADILVVFIEGAEIRRFECLVYRYAEFARDELRDGIDIVIRHTEHSADIAHCGARRHCAEGHYLRDMVGAVFFNDIVYNFASAFITEINIEIGHADPLGVEKALEQQAVFHRVNARYAYGIGGDTARARASAGTHGNIAASRVIYEIVDYQIIVDIAHSADDRELIVEALLILLRDILAVA